MVPPLFSYAENKKARLLIVDVVAFGGRMSEEAREGGLGPQRALGSCGKKYAKNGPWDSVINHEVEKSRLKMS